MISYKYKLYKAKKTKHLLNMKREACFVWNHALNLQKRYYAIYGKYIPLSRLKHHFAKRITRTYLYSQSTQEILERLDEAYNRFFKHIAKRPPKPKSHRDFTSFVYKQSGYMLCGNTLHINSVKRDYRFSYSRPYEGNVKQVRLKLSSKGDWYIYIITDATPNTYVKSHNGASVGIDFGLKTYMTLSTGEKIKHPQFLKGDLKRLQRSERMHSTKDKGSNNRERARIALNRVYEDISNRRLDYQWKLAHELCRSYDYIFIEDLSLTGMTKMWGRKMGDLAHGQFVGILEYVAQKYGCVVHKINRWYASSRLCDCGYKNDKLALNDREWVCPMCGQVHDRDIHAASNILRRGIYELESGWKTSEVPAKGHPTKTSSTKCPRIPSL